ncbi:MAG: glycosyltransferase family 1 protein [Puniceicoccaceae bacterium]|nr:MAG: glycosyltransferase family 1 protein [Puniceicoccaceae bacterium]
MTLNRLVRGLAGRGHELTVVRPRQAADRGAGREEDFAEWLVPGLPLPKYEGLMMGLPVVGRLWKRWREVPPDLVHIATEGPLGWAALGAARRLGIPVSTSFHTNFHRYGRHYGYGMLQEVAVGFLRSFHNQAACTLVPTREMVEELAAEGFQRLGVLSRGVDGGLFAPGCRDPGLRCRWGVDTDGLAVVYVGRLAKEKNIGLAVEAFLEIKRREPVARFILVGDGPERMKLEKEYPDFVFSGMRSGPDLAAHYASGDLFLFPSETETFGNVVTEALASGLLVLAYEMAAARQFIRSGVNGLTVPPGDRAAFIAAAAGALAQRDQWVAWRRAARAAVEPVTWAAVICGFEARLQQVASAGHPPAATL